MKASHQMRWQTAQPRESSRGGDREGGGGSPPGGFTVIRPASCAHLPPRGHHRGPHARVARGGCEARVAGAAFPASVRGCGQSVSALARTIARIARVRAALPQRPSASHHSKIASSLSFRKAINETSKLAGGSIFRSPILSTNARPLPTPEPTPNGWAPTRKSG